MIRFSYILTFSGITIFSNSIYFLSMCLIAIWIETDKRTLQTAKEKSIREENSGIYIYGFISLFLEVLLLPIHLLFGYLILLGHGKDSYRVFTSLIHLISGRKWFLFFGELFKK